jgi:hypothetical protein
LKQFIVDSKILGGQGSIGSRPLTVANPAPLTPGQAAAADGDSPLSINPGQPSVNGGDKLAPKSGEK